MREEGLLLEAKDLTKRYLRGSTELWALKHASLEIRRGEFVAIEGPSGSGKSTLLHILGCLDVPTSGSLHIRGVSVISLPDSRLALLRRRNIGFIFQSFNLLPTLRAWQNVALPLMLGGVPPRERRARALEALDEVGLAGRANHYPFELSGGEEQRVATARAMVTRPSLVLADEPTGNLDTETQDRFLDVLQHRCEGGMSVIVVTHNPVVAERASRRFTLVDGRLASG